MRDRFYRVGRALLNQSVRLYYRRVEVVGAQQIPSTGPAIIVANHPNSVADAFLLASCLTPRKINFIAKDTITRTPLIGWVLRRFGLVGVARAMDYQRQRELARQRNQAAIASCIPRLLAGEIVAVFGEGISTDARRLHMIRKGAMRFGYAAEQAAHFQLGLLWIPVAITYSAKQHFRSNVSVRVGEPFSLAHLDADPAAREAALLQRGTERLQRDLGAMLVNIEREELVDLIDRLAHLMEHPAGSLATGVERHRRIARAVEYFNEADPSRVAFLKQALTRYEHRLLAVGLTDDIVRQRHPTLALWKSAQGVLKNGALMLANLYGRVNSFVPRWTANLGRRWGRRQLPDGKIEVTKEALYGTLGGWIGAALAFPLQIYLVTLWARQRLDIAPAIITGALYGLSLIPSWKLFVQRRDIFRDHLAHVRDSLRYLLNAGPATRLHVRRRNLLRQLRLLLAAYEAGAPHAA